MSFQHAVELVSNQTHIGGIAHEYCVGVHPDRRADEVFAGRDVNDPWLGGKPLRMAGGSIGCRVDGSLNACSVSWRDSLVDLVDIVAV